MRRRAMGLAAQRAADRATAAPGRRTRLALVLPDLVGALGGALGVRRALARRAQRDAGATRLRQADRDRLLGRARAVLALADVVHLLAHELPRGSRGATSATQLLLRSLHGGSLRHGDSSVRDGLH